MGALKTAVKFADAVPRLLFSGFGVFFAAMSFFIISQQKENLDEAKAMQSWTPVACTVESAEIEDDGDDYRLRIVYRYQPEEGRILRSDRFSADKFLTAETMGEIDRAQKQYPAGRKMTGYFNPQNREEAILKLPELADQRIGMGMAFLFPSVGILFAVVPWIGFFRKKEREPENRTEPETPKKKGKGQIGLILFGSIFVIVGLAVTKPVLITPLLKIEAAKAWGTASAVVVSSKVKTHEGDDGDTYSAYIAYRYEYNGREYIGDQYSFIGGSSSGYESKAEKVRQHPPGKELTVYVNPENPSESVINPNPTPELLFGLIPLVFVLAGAGVMFAGIRAGGTRKLNPKQAGEHIVQLKAKSPVWKLTGISVFALVWNGVVVFLFIQNAPILFKTVFGFFGLFALFGVIHALLACFNPRPEVEITPGNMHPGTNAALRWNLKGSTERIQKLTIEIRCLKVNTVTRKTSDGTETSVEKIPLRTVPVFESQHNREIARNSIQFTLPPDLPPSRPGNDDGIEWQLLFHADIPKWPDLKESFKFLVYPEA